MSRGCASITTSTRPPPTSAMSEVYTAQELMVAVASREIHVGDPAGPAVKLPGSGGGADIAILSRRWVTLMNHERRRLVDRVSFLTSPGHGDGSRGWRERNGLLGGGPVAIITTLCVFRFPEGGGEAYLDTLHPGHTVEEVREQTGWVVKLGAQMGKTAPPTGAELTAIRRRLADN